MKRNDVNFAPLFVIIAIFVFLSVGTSLLIDMANNSISFLVDYLVSFAPSSSDNASYAFS
jgi:hypothetical protein